MINKQQNEWTKRQLFNPDTLVLRSTDGKNVTVVAAPGLASDEVVMLPGSNSGGSVIAFINAGSSVTQTISNAEALIDYNLVGDSLNITKAGANFTVHAPGKYQLYVWFHVQQYVNANVVRFWATKNGVAIPYFGTSVELRQNGDQLSVSAQGYVSLVDGDVISVRGISVLPNGAQLFALAAAPPAPELESATMQLMGYSL